MYIVKNDIYKYITYKRLTIKAKTGIRQTIIYIYIYILYVYRKRERE